MSFIQDFKDFAFKGNLIDMAVGIVMGGAVAAIVKSFLDNIITPLIAMIGGVPDMSQLWLFPVGDAVTKMVDGKEVTEQAAIRVGTFVQNTLDFAILALVIFIALKIAAKWMKAAEDDAPPSDEVVLLTEIRDALAKR